MSTRHRPLKELEAERPNYDFGSSFKLTKVMNPDFEAGDGLNELPTDDIFLPTSPSISIDPATLPVMPTYKMLISAVAPRPIAFISTLDPDGVPNCMPCSYFNVASHEAGIMMISISARAGNEKGTLKNIRHHKQFTISVVSENWLEAANMASIDAPDSTSEWSLTGLTKKKSEVVKPPYVAESAFSMELELDHLYDMKTREGEYGGTVVLGRVVRYHVKENVLDKSDLNYKLDLAKLRPASQLGGISYGRMISGYELYRHTWAEVKDRADVHAALAKGDKNLD